MKHTFSIDYFLQDPEFIRWVRNQDPEMAEYWRTFLDKHPYSRNEMLQAAEIVRSLNIKRDTPTEPIRNEVLENIVGKLNTLPVYRDKEKNNGYLGVFLRYAAIVVIAVTSVFVLDRLHQKEQQQQPLQTATSTTLEKETKAGQKSTFWLRDGTVVTLNSESRLEYDFDQKFGTRVVYLKGEAYFDVKEDPQRPFIVRTESLAVTALGTSFNVRAYPETDRPEVALVTGRVQVAVIWMDHPLVELNPGEKAIWDINEKNIGKSKFDYIKDIGWRDGIIAFERASFEEVKMKLERWYGVTIQPDDPRPFQNWEVDGYFENQSLARVLDHFAYTKGFSYEISYDKVILTRKDKPMKNE